jgi:hypothetical protein
MLICVVSRFGTMSVAMSADTYDEEAMKLAFARVRSDVIEMVIARSVLLVLTRAGLCTAYDRMSLERICILNSTQEEV